MKINVGKFFGKAVRYAKANPEKVIAIAMIAGGPLGKIAVKAAPLIVAATGSNKEPGV